MAQNNPGGSSKSRSLIVGLIVTTMMSLFLFIAPQSQAKEFIDDLTTDFFGGTEDNIQIQQNLKGSLKLSPYAILGNWSPTSTPSSTSLYLSSTTVYNGKVYLTGGFGSTESAGSGDADTDNAINKIWYATVLSDGKVEEWKEVEDTSRLPQPTYGHSAIVLNGRIYIIGGSSSLDKTPSNSVYWAKILGHDGSIKAHYDSNTWTAVAALPTPLYRAAAAKYEGRIYVTGGIDLSNQAQNVVYYADVQPSGDITTWNTASNLLPTSLAGHAMTQSNGRLYVVAGSTTGEQINSSATVYIGDIDPLTGDITNWTSAATLPEALFGTAAAISAGKIWVSGGVVSGTAKANVYYARIDPVNGLIPGVGGVDTWTRTTDLPVAVYNHNMVAFNGHLFITGGFNAGASSKFYTSTLLTNKTNITKWIPTTPLFLSPYGEGSLKTWTGHTALLRVPLQEESSFSSGSPTVFVIGGGSNTYNAFAHGFTEPDPRSAKPEAYSTVYNSTIDSNGSLKTWAAPDTGGSIPVAVNMHMSTMSNGAMYVIGGANSLNASIWADAAARSATAFGFSNTINPTAFPYPIGYGETIVYYEQLQAGGSGEGAGTFEKTAPVPIFDPAYEFDWTFTRTGTGTIRGQVLPDPVPAHDLSAEPIYQPLIRAAVVSHNGYIYVIGGISRENDAWVADVPQSSQRYYENRVWYCRPNPGGTINDVGGPGGWKPTTPLVEVPLISDGLGPRYDAAAVVAYGRIYLFGGRDETGAVRDTVYYAIINDNGSLGEWVEDTPMASPLSQLAEHQVIFTSGRFYVIGGKTGNAINDSDITDSVYYCTPMAKITTPNGPSIPPIAGDAGAWETSQTRLEYPVAGHKCVSYNGYIYLTGGRYRTADPHTSSAYLTNIADMRHTQNFVYAGSGNFERYVDFDKDQLIENINWDSNPNNEIVRIRYRYALEEGLWSPWSLEQAVGPMEINRFARYVHYKVHLETLTNDPASFANTPEVSRVIINRAASKRVDKDNFQINHNKFDPQVEQLTVTYKTRDHSVDNVIIRVYNLEGELVRLEELPIPPGTLLPATGSWIWDGTNNNAELVANGVYIIQYNSGDTHKIRKVLVYKQ